MKPPAGVSTPAKTVPLRNNGSARRSASSSSDEKFRRIGVYAVQCANCFKFRAIPTQEEYEAIRHNLLEDPWFCSRKPNVSCDDPTDLDSDDATTFWVVDKPNLPKTPAGCQRILIMRKDFSKLDATYVMPNGKRTRSIVDVNKFLEAYPEYKDQFSASDFSFTMPKIMEGVFTRKPQSQDQEQDSGKELKILKMED